MLLKTSIGELTEEDIEYFRSRRKNTRESNHPHGEDDFMEILLAGSKELIQEFTKSGKYKIDLGDSE
jgi:hypothetical protein